jgi:hypothetical protein
MARRMVAMLSFVQGASRNSRSVRSGCSRMSALSRGAWPAKIRVRQRVGFRGTVSPVSRCRCVT